MANTASGYTLLDHTADLGVRVYGPSLTGLFEIAGRALVSLMLRGKTPEAAVSREMRVSGQDLPDLMVRWLGEILYLFEGEKRVVTSIRVRSVIPTLLRAAVKTVPFDPAIHEVLHEIKAVTYHQIRVTETDGRWEGTIIFDL